MQQSTPKPLVVIYMILAGLGLGFVMPNLTVFAQETAGRSLLGISTAMLQSVRMIGGMLGTTIVGTLVTKYYASGVRDRSEEHTSELQSLMRISDAVFCLKQQTKQSAT